MPKTEICSKVRDHSFSTYAKFSGVRNVSFSENIPYVLNELPLRISSLFCFFAILEYSDINLSDDFSAIDITFLSQNVNSLNINILLFSVTFLKQHSVHFTHAQMVSFRVILIWKWRGLSSLTFLLDLYVQFQSRIDWVGLFLTHYP